jgi:hypothetical protein
MTFWYGWIASPLPRFVAVHTAGKCCPKKEVALKLPERGRFPSNKFQSSSDRGGFQVDRKRSVLMVLLVVIAYAVPAGAQVFTPSYMAPRSASDIGVYLSDGPGDFAIEGIWRRAGGAYDLGLRAGLADTPDVGILLGAELRNPLSVGAPLDLAVTGHAQGLIIPDSDSGAGFLVGLSIGHTFDTEGISFTPYFHPRAGLIAGFGADELDLDLLADLGFDVRFSPSLELRIGLSFEDRGGDWGIGLAWR